MTCPNCNLLLDVPSEVTRGSVVGVCSGCGTKFGPAVEAAHRPIDHRGAPSKPGAGQKIHWEM